MTRRSRALLGTAVEYICDPGKDAQRSEAIPEHISAESVSWSIHRHFVYVEAVGSAVVLVLHLEALARITQTGNPEEYHLPARLLERGD